MPLDVGEGVPRLDHVITERGNAHVQGAQIEMAEIKSALLEMRGLHPQGAAGKTRIAIEAGSHAMAGNESGGDNLLNLGIHIIQAPPQRLSRCCMSSSATRLVSGKYFHTTTT